MQEKDEISISEMDDIKESEIYKMIASWESIRKSRVINVEPVAYRFFGGTFPDEDILIEKIMKNK